MTALAQAPTATRTRPEAAASTCVIDHTRPCNGCSAAGPASCPYLYILADDFAAAGARD